MPPLSSKNQQILCDLFQSHGVQAHLDGDWIVLPERGRRARAEVFDHEGAPEGTRTVQLDVTLELWTGRRVIDSCGGVGTTHAAAVASAWENFTASTFHVLLAAFFYQESDRVSREAWEIGEATRAVTVGDVGLRGKPPGGSLDMAWLQTLRTAIEEVALIEGAHWVRVYFARSGSRDIGCEVLLDNEPWEEVQAAMTRAPWPEGPDFWSVRQFLVVQGGLDVSRSVATMIEMQGHHDDDIAKVLERDGASASEAQALLAYIPLAFGRVLMEGLPIRLADTALVQDQTGEAAEERTLGAEPIFAEATRLAERVKREASLTSEQFTAVAMRSAEVDAVNKALHGGAKPEDLVVSPPFITLG